MDREQFTALCNRWAGEGRPFLFAVDFEMGQFVAVETEHAAAEGILYDVNGQTNVTSPPPPLPPDIVFDMTPVSRDRYDRAFSLVKKNIIHGNSFLLNLTFPTRLHTNLDPRQIFGHSVAPYRMLYKDRFVVFSPESFVKIRGRTIASYPMKGTIDAAVPDAEKRLLSDEKEQWEHNTIVDLIRNDLSMVAKEVRVKRFRYVDRVQTHRHALLQVSSEVEGMLAADWRGRLGEILLTMLPAGSISGAPKRKTVEIIRRAEGEKRGFFTGVFGLFDGESVDSAVMIRFIEKKEGGLQFRSGGGITGHSRAGAEYREMIDKVYLPL